MSLQSNFYPVPIVAGTTAGTYAAGDDPRLSDEQTPPDNAVTNAKLANVATSTIKGRAAAGTGDPEDLSASQVRTLLNVADGAEVNVQSNWTEADSGSDSFILNKPTLGTAAAQDADQDLGTTDDVAFNSVGFGGDFTIDSVGLNWFGQNIFEAETNTFNDLSGDFGFGVATTSIQFGKKIRLQNTGEASAVVELDADSVSTATTRNISFPDASGTIALVGDAPASHTHGNLSNDGKIGTTSGLPLKTGTSGVVEAGAFGTGAGEFCEGNDARLTDARTPTSHAASHAIGGSDAIAPSDIGAQSLFTTSAIVGATTLSAGRARIFDVSNYSSAYTIVLPITGSQNGDIVVFRGTNLINATVTIEYVASPSNVTIGTITAVDQQYRFIYRSGPQDWALVAVDTHTHAASDITSGTLTHERGGLEADVSAYSGLLKIASGSTSAVTVTSAGEALLDDADAAAQRTTLGLGNSATLDTGTTAGTVAAGDHTHTQLHDRSHAITSTSDHTAGNHKVFYSNGSGEVVELALGDSGKVLQSNGASAAPTWETPSGGVSAIGTSAADILSVSGSDIVADDAGADRIVFWDDSESKLAYLEAGSGLSISGTTITATASGGSKTYAVFTPDNNQPPASNYATLDTRNSVACLDYDDATDESGVFVGIIPEGASLGSGLKIRIHWAATTATSGDVRWDVQLERMTTDLDSDSFDTVASATATTNGTSGILTVTEITLTTIDSVTAGDGFRLKVTRDANNAADTMSGDCELYICEVRSAA